MINNAIILAAGKSTRFAPFTYERPKGLFRVKGEYLIERQINQLIDAGVKEIYIVVGYMKEKFFFLEQKYPEVKLLINNKFGVKGMEYLRRIHALEIPQDGSVKTFDDFEEGLKLMKIASATIPKTRSNIINCSLSKNVAINGADKNNKQ